MAPAPHECKPAAIAALRAAVEMFGDPDNQAKDAELQVLHHPSQPDQSRFNGPESIVQRIKRYMHEFPLILMPTERTHVKGLT